MLKQTAGTRQAAGQSDTEIEEIAMDPDEAYESEWIEQEEHPRIDRVDVGLRAVYSLLFALIISVLESLLVAVVIFQLLYSLVSEKLPGDRVQAFAHRLVAYFYQILRYLTHTDSVIPFPFSDFPTPPEPTRPAYAPRRGGVATVEESG